jgi:phosphohistidine swiveling domain-containing protein
VDAVDPTHIPGAPELHWSTDNVGEALPGVVTPLSWTIWSDTGDLMIRDTMYALGVFSRAERLQPARLDDRLIQPFYGRIALRIEWLASVGDRMPGATGPDAVTSMLGRVPETLEFAPTRRRYPVIAAKLPPVALTAPGRVRAAAIETHSWWQTRTGTVTVASQAEAVAVLTEAHRRFGEVMTLHTIALMSVLTPLLDGVTALVEKTGVGTVGALSGTGGAEMRLIEDLWRASRGEITEAELVAEHGYHGPLEGEISSRVWRDDPTPLARMIEGYAKRPDSDSPAARERRARERLPELQREVVARLPRLQRAPARLLLAHAAKTLPLRGVGKASFLQAIDVARAAARRIGEHLADADTLADREDVFYLTLAELTATIPVDARDRVAQRRATREQHQQVTIPGSWRGTPTVTPISSEAPETEIVTGIGVSAGVVEGIVRLVTDPSFADVEPDEILVTPTTDPSWASIMFLSGALVVDIGGALSHAAVVARELGIPCVVNTRNGTRMLHTGDRVRVDGSTGTVEVLARAGAAQPSV